MHELRRHRRLKIPLQVEIRHPAIGTLQVAASDMSDGGIFLVMDECFQLEIGESVIIRTLGLGADGKEVGPPLVMRVVRRNSEGMGLSLEENASANLGSLDGEKLSGKSVLQSLLITNDRQQVLFIQEKEHWQLPSRQLESEESWQQGIQANLETLKTSRVLNQEMDLEVDPSCYPNAMHNTSGINLLIPCKLNHSAPLSQNHSQDNDLSFRWVEQSDIPHLSTTLDTNLVDKILCQV